MRAAIFLIGFMLAGSAAADLSIVNATLIAAPGEDAQQHVTIEIRGGRIDRIETAAGPQHARVLDADGRVVTAGFWNCHVHLTSPALADDPATVMREMLLHYGFTSVVDTGSELTRTQRLQAAIREGTLNGPRIVIASGSFVYTDGTPAYLPDVTLPEVTTAAEAVASTNAVLDRDVDGIKIFSGSFQSPTETIWLPPAIIRAIADAAHARDAFVMSHPTDRTGLERAVRNGVDVLAHTAPRAGPLSPSLLREMLDNDVALIPTLKLWSWELGRGGASRDRIEVLQDAGVTQLSQFFGRGGEVLFGTDVGYMRDYDPSDEFTLMARAGMDFTAILASLTTLPARRFSGEAGIVEPGAPADLVLYAADPREDARAFADIAVTIRQGDVVFTADP